MKKLLLVSIALTLLGSSVPSLAKRTYKDYIPHTVHHTTQYKDMVYKDVPTYSEPANWTGLYAGVVAGPGWGNQPITQSSITNTPQGAVLNSAINRGAIPSSISNSPSGYILGAELGYNYQISRAVLGIEADAAWANIQDENGYNNGNGNFLAYHYYAKQELESMYSLRGRLGISPIESLLFYATGGVVYASTRITASISTPGCVGFCGSNSTTGSASGWIGGLGIEYLITDELSAKAEYLYYDIEGQSQHISDQAYPNTFLKQDVTFDGNLVRVGLNYKLW